MKLKNIEKSQFNKIDVARQIFFNCVISSKVGTAHPTITV